MTAQTSGANDEQRGSRWSHSRRVLVAAIAGASLLLAGCAAGQRAQTSIETPVIDGVGANVGLINLRAVTIAAPANGSYPSGGTAGLQLYIVNTGAPDQLISVSSPAAKSASLFTNAAAEFAIPPSSAAPTPTPTPTSSTPTATGSSSSKSGSGSASASASVTASTSTAAPTTPAASSSTATAPAVTIPIASGETTPIGVGSSSAQITLVGLDSALYPAMSIPITFTFANAGSVTVMVAVHLSSGAVNAPTLAITHDTDDE